MSKHEHPKSAVCRLIAQNFNQSQNTIVLKEPVFSHKYVQLGNKNIFYCSVVIIYNDKQFNFSSDKGYLNKKDCERCVFQKILEFLKNIINKKPVRILNNNNVNRESYSSHDSCGSNDSNNKSNITNTIPQTIPQTINPKTTKRIVNKIDDHSINKTDKYPINKINNDSIPKNNNNNNNNSFIFDMLKSGIDLSTKVIIIVDFENISRLDDVAKLYDVVIPNKDVIVLKVAGFCSSIKHNADIVVRSNRKDAVDHYISYLVGLLESENTCPITYIITRDKFGSCLQDFCKNVTHCSDVTDFFDMIDR